MNDQAPLRNETKPAEDDRPVKLLCKDVWKVFGDGAKACLAKHNGAPTSEDLNKAKLVGAVRQASLEVRRGENFIVMGLSGSGKSTLVRCLSRLIEPTWGTIELDGINLLKASPDELIEIRRHRMGMVFQHFALLPHLTVLENIAFPLSVQGVDRKTREARARKVIDLVGLDGREQFYPRELSGGQQQRVGIARSLAVEPEIWFLDEPFSALDPLIRREMQSELLRLQSVLKKTIVFITHDFDEAIRLADRVAIMKDGEIIQTGTPEELVLHPATDYVAEFTRDVQRAKVMSAARLMRPVLSSVEYGGTVKATDKVSTFSARIVGVRKNFLVTAADGRPVGEVTPDDVIDLLADRDQRQEARA